jgi:redox-sensing transcriptional repressor
LLGVPSWLIRKDFSYFGDFGTRGVGYNIKKLTEQIKKILKLNGGRKVALVGVGDLGSAVLTHHGFKLYGFDIVAAFDADSRKTGRRINGLRVEGVSRLGTLKKRKIELAIIAVPRDAAQQTADALVEAGIRGILNLSPCNITVAGNVKLIRIDIATDLARLPYYVPTSRV